MSVITVRDVEQSSAMDVEWVCGSAPSRRPLDESDLADVLECQAPIPPPAPSPVFPVTVSHDTRLLAFESTRTRPLCLQPPTRECRKRGRVDQVAEEETTCDDDGVLARTPPPKRSEPWMAWLNWDHFE